jgi:NAD(P)-dependent dehydrogenase (short-subunit alcohol dehydrogenase family)
MTLNGKRVAIIGGGSGIGYAVAEACVANGAQVTIASSSLERVQASAAKLGAGTRAAQVNVKNEASVAALFESGGGFDHIVTTAGNWDGPRRGPLVDVELEASKTVFDVRFWGALLLAKHGVKTLSPNGSITFTNGMVAHNPSKGSSVSTAMAGAIEHLTRALAVELAPIRVNAVCPGLILTGVWDSIPADQREARLQAMTKNQLLPRAGTPAECAQAYLYLMLGGYTTGQVLFVEGGSALSR